MNESNRGNSQRKPDYGTVQSLYHRKQKYPVYDPCYIGLVTDFFRIVRYGEVNALEQLFEDYRNLCEPEMLINEAREQGTCATALGAAVELGKIDMCAFLLKQPKVDVNVRDSFMARTPLHIAAHDGKDEIVRMLIDEYHANTEKKNIHGRTALFESIRGNHGNTLKLLVQLGAKYENIEDAKHRSVLSVALKYKCWDAVDYLLTELKMKIHPKDLEDVLAENHRDALSYLLTKKHMLGNERTRSGRETLLHVAVRLNDRGMVTELLDHGADIDAKDEDGKPVIITNFETYRGHTDISFTGWCEMYKVLMRYNPNLNMTLPDGRRVFQYVLDELPEDALRILNLQAANQFNTFMP